MDALIGDLGLVALGAGLAIVGGALGTAWVQATVGSSIMGVVAERPEQANKLLIYFLIPETLVVFGLAVAYLIIQLGGH